jgi:23S rRNA (uracil1939-C5)-methyltransferase
VTSEYDIVRLGAQGDGVAETPEGSRFVPFALPGERVRLTGPALPEVIVASSERVAPVCPHFGTCGGCVAQHMSGPLYGDWKRGIVVEALRQHGLAADVAPLVRVAPGSRRRAVLTARREGGGVVLGYHQRRSHELVAIAECPVLLPAIVAQLPGLRALADLLAAPEIRMTVLHSQGGLDVSIEKGAQAVKPALFAALARVAAEHGLVRVAMGGQTIVERAEPVLSIGGVSVVPPPGAFVQAAEAAEHAMRDLIAGALGRAKRVADLFCGIGTWTFPIARRARVLAADGDHAALEALSTGARKAQGLKPIEVLRRDLFREPLSARELKGFDGVVFDPPRAGAKAQAEQLARSGVPVVVAVSCDPGTLARDLRILVDGDYRLGSVTPIDQFEFSAHVEAVAVLRRAK